MSHISWSDGVSQLVTQPSICSINDSLINPFSQPCSHSSHLIHWFIHASSPLVSQQPNQPADWNSVDTDTDVSALVGLTAHLELLAASWPLDVSILPWTSHKRNTLLSLSFSIWNTKKAGKDCGGVAQVHFTKTVCVCSMSGFLWALIGLYWMGPSSC